MRKIEMVITKGRLSDDQDLDTLRYWLGRPMEERFSAMEELRQAWHGEDYALTHRLSQSDLRIQRRKR